MMLMILIIIIMIIISIILIITILIILIIMFTTVYTMQLQCYIKVTHPLKACKKFVVSLHLILMCFVFVVGG